ncbi:MAG: translational GTPase TypA [Waddliaceae bacterium]
MYSPKNIRNIAIIAHVDHGKTTLLDALLRQSRVFHANQEVPERVMDSYDQEKERGITIFSKHTSIHYGDYKINIIDTPGHADFSSEVERVLGMVNAVLLIVDAQEGPMPQTRFVLSKALKMGLTPLVILNKIDRANSNPDKVLNETFDLFIELGAEDEQLDFKHCYASALEGYAQRELDDPRDSFLPLMEMIVNDTPAPAGEANDDFLMQAATVSFDDYLGKQACGRILQGTIRRGGQVRQRGSGREESLHTVTKIEGYLGLQKVELEEAIVGDIVSLSGIPEVNIGDTLCTSEHQEPLPPIQIEPPTVSVDITVNDSPFVGKSGKHVTMNKIKARLFREKQSNVSYAISEKDERTITLAGRGELHLAVLLEAMRREGFEFCVAKPRIIVKVVDGIKHEPLAKAYIEVPQNFSGTVIEQLSVRRGEMQSLATDDKGITRIEFLIPVRGLIGYSNEFLTSTKGLGILTSIFDHYSPWKGDFDRKHNGALISMCQGKVNTYASYNLESRGELFTSPGDEIYEGMIVGKHNRENDLVVNLTRGKQLTNVRASGSDEKLILRPPRRFNLEQAIGYIHDDELVEIVPHGLRLRKKYLKEVDRHRTAKKKSSS